MAITINKPAVEERDQTHAVGNGHDNGVIVRRPPLQTVWDALAHCRLLGSVADIHTGVHYKTGLVAECVSAQPKPDYVPGILTAGNSLEAYLVTDYQYVCAKPDVMKDHAYQLPWDKPKVIANVALLSRGYWSISGAVDYQGILPSQQFYGLWPKGGDMPVEVVASVISGPVANAYLFGCPPASYNQIRWIKQIPVPDFTPDQMDMIAMFVQDYISYRGQWIAEPRREEFLKPKCLDLLYLIDAAVLEAYNLPAELERMLLQKFNGAERGLLPFDFPGYGADYECAKRRLQEEQALRRVLKRHHTLIEKKYLVGLTETEKEELEHLSEQVDASNAPFYDKVLSTMNTADS